MTPEELLDARQEYLDQVSSRVCPSFANATTVVEFLKTVAIDVFVPTSWEGIKGVKPIRLRYKGKPPHRLKPKPRRIPAAVYEATKKEFQRLLKYFYRPSTSSITSPIVVAPKATDPFVRICGDYVLINKLIGIFNFAIPDVRMALHKAALFCIFIDLDVRNAFHNLVLHDSTAAMLSADAFWSV